MRRHVSPADDFRRSPREMSSALSSPPHGATFAQFVRPTAIAMVTVSPRSTKTAGGRGQQPRKDDAKDAGQVYRS